MQSPTSNNISTDPRMQSLVAGFYARVSTGRQEHEETIDSQVDEIKQRIAADGNILPEENIFLDDGWTGSILQRPGLDAMLEAARSGKFQILYVYDLGRVARKYHYQQVVLEELENREIRFISLHDKEVENDEDRVWQGFQGLFHEYERVKIYERFRRGKLYRAKQGSIINGQALYGYARINRTKDTPAQYLIQEEAARAVRMIFDWFGVDLLSIHQIIKELHKSGIPPRKGKSEFWTKGPIIRLLSCETYVTGKAYYNKSKAVPTRKPTRNIKYRKVKNGSRRVRPREEWIPFDVPKILNRAGDDLLFQRIQDTLENNKKYARKKRNHPYLLSGLVYCECGKRRTGDGSNTLGHHYYRCVERIYTPPDKRECASPGINADALDEALWEKLVTFMGNPTLLREHAQQWITTRAHQQTMNNSERDRLLGSVKKVEEEEERYQRAYGAGVMEFDQLEKLMRECRNRKADFRAQLKSIEEQDKPEVPTDSTRIDALCREARLTFQRMDFSNRREVLKELVEKVIIHGQRKAEVWGHIPVTTNKLGSYDEDRNCRITQRRKIDAL